MGSKGKWSEMMSVLDSIGNVIMSRLVERAVREVERGRWYHCEKIIWIISVKLSQARIVLLCWPSLSDLALAY